MTGTRATVEERLWRNCIPEPNSGCWIWLASVHPKSGYGQIAMPGGPQRAHRVSYKVFKGKIPKGLDIRHSCDMRCCINPDHLEPGTRKQNMQDAEKRGRIARRFKLPQTKLTDAQVVAIIADKRTQNVVAADYGIDQSYVTMLKNGRASRTKIRCG